MRKWERSLFILLCCGILALPGARQAFTGEGDPLAENPTGSREAPTDGDAGKENSNPVPARREGAEGERESVTVVIETRMWQKQPPPEKMTVEDAIRYCAELDLGGRRDWRLPTVDELRALIKGCPETEIGGACSTRDKNHGHPSWSEACQGCPYERGPAQGCYRSKELKGDCGWTWSSVCPERCDDDVWGVNFRDGSVTTSYTYHEEIVRCVRSQP